MYKKVVSGRKESWDECCGLRKEVKESVREKLSMTSRKEVWAFVGRRTKGKYKNITYLKSKAVSE